MIFSNHAFLINSGYGSTFTTLTLYISQSCKNKECCAKTRFEYVEMHTNWLDFYLIGIVAGWVFDLNSLNLKASAHSFKQFTSRLLKSTLSLSLSLSMHIYNSDGRHAWFHLHGASRPARSASEATKYKMKNFLSTLGLEPTTLRFKVWCSTDWASRAWWMLSI